MGLDYLFSEALVTTGYRIDFFLDGRLVPPGGGRGVAPCHLSGVILRGECYGLDNGQLEDGICSFSEFLIQSSASTRRQNCASTLWCNVKASLSQKLHEDCG